MQFEIATTRQFCAAHALKLYDGTMEPVHGHNWRVQVRVVADQLDVIGVVMDFHELERRVDAIVVPWHNRHLNECLPFSDGLNPSAENVALHLARTLQVPDGVRLQTVDVWETDDNVATVRL